MQAGLAMFLALSAFLGFETANGYFDTDAERITVPVLDIAERGLRPTRRTYTLVVEDSHSAGQKTELFWGSGYPEGWNVPGNCLIATVGPGAFGLRWIADKRIAPCQEQ